jgi:hypothetical protein
MFGRNQQASGQLAQQVLQITLVDSTDAELVANLIEQVTTLANAIEAVTQGALGKISGEALSSALAEASQHIEAQVSVTTGDWAHCLIKHKESATLSSACERCGESGHEAAKCPRFFHKDKVDGKKVALVKDYDPFCPLCQVSHSVARQQSQNRGGAPGYGRGQRFKDSHGMGGFANSSGYAQPSYPTYAGQAMMQPAFPPMAQPMFSAPHGMAQPSAPPQNPQ